MGGGSAIIGEKLGSNGLIITLCRFPIKMEWESYSLFCFRLKGWGRQCPVESLFQSCVGDYNNAFCIPFKHLRKEV